MELETTGTSGVTGTPLTPLLSKVVEERTSTEGSQELTKLEELRVPRSF